MLFTCFLNIFPKARYVYLSYLCMVTALLTFTTKKMCVRPLDAPASPAPTHPLWPPPSLPPFLPPLECRPPASFICRRRYTKSFNQGVFALDLDSKAYDAAGVGAMLLCMANFGLIIFIGVSSGNACRCSPASPAWPSTGGRTWCFSRAACHVRVQLGAAKALEEEGGGAGGGGGANGTATYGGGSVAFTSVSTQGPATGIGNTAYGHPGQSDALVPKPTGVPPAAPASF